jgi:hypothetical protein
MRGSGELATEELMGTLVEEALRLDRAQAAARALGEHARACPRCAHAERRCLHANAYCPTGRAWLFRWRHATWRRAAR